jgi:hypothetical protein
LRRGDLARQAARDFCEVIGYDAERPNPENLAAGADQVI